MVKKALTSSSEPRDYNGDGLLDIIVSNRKGVFVFKQLAAGK